MQAFGQRTLLLTGFLASLLAVGIPYWVIPYSSVSLPDALIGFGVIVVILAALALRAWVTAPFWKTTLVIGASVPAVVLARVFVEATADPTSHNLWPLEITIAMGVGFAAALIGTVAGSLIAKLMPRRAGDEQP